MENIMKVTLKMIKNMGKVNLDGQMEENILVDGLMENNMEEDILLHHKKIGDQVNGYMEKKLGGLMMKSRKLL